MKVEKFLKTMVNAEILVENDALPETVWEYLESQGVNINVEQLVKFIKDVKEKNRYSFWH